MNHTYSTPELGTTDWHIPLNENFTQLDTDVEIRDTAASRDDYDPKDGAKFLATDTGEVYLGDGSNWTRIGALSTGGDGGPVPVARPGELQATIDRYANEADWPQSARTHIHLVPGRTYTPGSTIELRRGVALQFNGALLKPNHDEDIVHQYPGTALHNPRIEARQTGWSGGSDGNAAFVKWDSGWSGSGKYAGTTLSEIHNATLCSKPGTGRGIVISDSAATGIGGGGPTISGRLQNQDVGVDLVAEGGSNAYVNTFHMNLKLIKNRIGIRHRAVPGGATNAHYIVADTQPLSGTSEYLWDLGTESKFNTLVTQAWDTRYYEGGNDTLWRIRSDAGFNNTLVDTMGFLDPDAQVDDRAGRDSNAIFQYNEKAFNRSA
jgi:hypothetical protein